MPPPPGVEVGCIPEGPGEVTMVWDKDAHAVTFAGGIWQIGSSADIAWPAGFSAREYQGRAELVAPDGRVIARDGEPVSSISGTDPAHACA